jgi:large subunit ribosomal protein L24
MPQKKFVQPKDRIARWNIRQGDYVRLLVGKKEDKFVNQKNADGGWKIHRVTAIDLERNTLKLNDVTVSNRVSILSKIMRY